MNAVTLGRDITTGEKVCLGQMERRAGLYIIGKTGTGKTGLLVNLIIQDIEQGLGVCFLDPHGDATDDLLARLPSQRCNDVILLDPLDTEHPFGLNLYECADPQNPELVTRTVEQVMQVFEKLWHVGRDTPRIAQFLRNCTLTLLANPGYTMADIPLLLLDAECRARLVARVTNPQVQLFWESYNQLRPSEQLERAESTLNKIDEFLSPLVKNIVGQRRTTVNFRQVMDERKILLVKLPGGLQDITTLLGTMIVGQIHTAALSRADTLTTRRRQFHLYADEYQRFSTPDFASLLAEARKFAVATTVVHQWRSQLDESNQGATLNAANVIVFQVNGAEDAEELAKQFKAIPAPREIIGQEPIMQPRYDIVEYLATHDHPNPDVMGFVRRWLRPISTKELFLRPHFDFPKSIEEIYQNACQSSSTEGPQFLIRLNDFLAEGVRMKNSFLPFPLRILGRGTNKFDRLDLKALGFPHILLFLGIDEYDSLSLKNAWTRWGRTRPPEQEIAQRIFGSFLTSPDGRAKGTQEEKQAAIKAIQDIFGWAIANKNPYYIPGHSFWKGAGLPDYSKPERWEYVEASREELEALIHLFIDGDPKERYKRTYPFALAETQQAEAFFVSLRIMVKALVAEPIMVESGRYIPKYGLEETIKNAQDRNATKLATLAPFTAHCKIIENGAIVEHTIRTLPLPPGLTGQALTDQREQLLQQARDHYCKRRQEVDEEIRERQKRCKGEPPQGGTRRKTKVDD